MSCENCEKLQRELFSALAAIEKQPHGHGCHLRSARPFGEQRRKEWDAKGCDCWKSKVDLSPLHEHDVEVRKPLVEAITRLHSIAETLLYELKGKLPNPNLLKRDLIGEALIHDLTKQIDALAKVKVIE